MHNLQADHLDCKLPSLFNRRQQYHFLKILNKGQFFLKSAVFIDRLDLISDEDLQKFFYSNCKIFFERLDQENDENAYRGEIMKWGYTFFIDFNHATTNSELEIILSSFCDLVIHHRHMDNRSSVMIKLKEHILENRPMFTDEKEENK